MTVYRKLDAFESAAGVRTFEYAPTGYVLTGPGEDMLASAGCVGEFMDDLARRLVGRDTR